MSRNRLGFVATVLVAVGLALPAIPAFAADDWVNVATISPTTTLTPRALCYTDGRDIACDGTAGLIGAGANLSETIAINDLKDASASTAINSLFMGEGNGAVNTGTYNTGVGIGVLVSNTTGIINTGLGAWALKSNTTGNQNTGLGSRALYLNTTGGANTAVGMRALDGNTTGSYNIALGTAALLANLTGSGNMGLGYNALANVTTSNSNTAVGYYAGYTTTSGFYNLLLGYAAYAPTATSNYALNIGNSIFGDMTNAAAGVGGASKIGINYVTPSVALEVSGTVSATRFVGDGSGLTGMASANLSETIAINDLSDASASTALASLFMGNGTGIGNTTGSSNTAVGIKALAGVSTGFNNTALGARALANSNGSWNTAIGSDALSKGTGGAWNTAVGDEALTNNTNGNSNTANGSFAMYNNTTGTANSANGSYAMYVNTTGTYNSANGAYALYLNATGNNNVADGYSALYNGGPVSNTVAVGTNAAYGVNGSTTFANGVFVGYASGQAITTGGNNTFLGAYSGLTTTTGGSNIALGYNVKLPTATTSSALNIGNSIFGDMTSAAAGVGGAAKIGINMVTPTASLEVSGTVSATRFVGDGSGLTGVASNLSETIAINDLSDAASDVASGTVYLGSGSGATSTGVNNTAVGVGSLASNTTGNSNVANGYKALGKNTTGSSNAVTGYYAMPNNTTGVNNTANGNQALQANTNGAWNLANGSSAMYSNTSGQFNVANGGTAMYGNTTGFYNVATGSNALRLNTTGYNNVAEGYQALYYANPVSNSVALGTNAGLGVNGSTTFANGVFVGYASGQAITTGGNNTFLGAYAGDSVTTGGSNIIIGYNADAPTATTSNSLNIGNTIYGDISMKRVGVNVASPTVALEVNGTVSATKFVGDGSSLTNISTGAGTFASLTDVSYSATYAYLFGPGSLTGAHSAAMHSTAYGDAALSNAGNVGTGNSAFGRRALYSNTTGNNNTAAGAFAMNNATTAVRNTAVGTYALAYNALGGANVAVGYYALTSSTGTNPVQVTDTVAIGYYAGQSMVNSERNVLIGSYAGNLVNGSSNTFVGYNSAAGVTTGASNISLGAGTSPYSNTGSWQLNIGNAIWGNIGSGMAKANLIGINVPSPTQALEVSGTVKATAFVGDGSGLTGIASGSSNEITSGTTKVSTNSNGYISLTTGGVTTGYFDTTGRLIVPSISVTSLSGISVTSATFSGSIGVGTATPGFLPANSVYTKGDLYSDNYVRGWEFGVVNNGGVRWGDWTTYVTGTGGSNIDMAIANQLALRVLPGSRVAMGGLTTTTVSLEVSGTVSATRFVGDGSGLTGLPAGNLSETIAINDLSDASASVVKGSLYMGDSAGTSGGSLNNNTGIGISAITNNSGTQVTAVGASAGYANAQDYLTAMGYRAGYSNTGPYSTLVGTQAGYLNHTGYLTAMGYQAGYNNIGMYNTTIGASAGLNNNATYVTTLGYQAGKNNVYQNVTLLGYNVQANKDNQVVLGNGSVVEVSTSGVILSAGLKASGVVTATYFEGDGSRLTGIASGASSEITSGTTKVSTNSNGYISLTTGGTTTGYFDTVGALTLPGVSATGTVSAAMVTVGGAPLTTSSTNIALGFNTQQATSGVGTGNLAIGGFNMTWGAVAGNNNIVIGSSAGNKVRTTNGNVMMGAAAGNLNTSGDNNTLIGSSAASTLTGGGSNTVIGGLAGHGLGDLSTSANNILIGAGISMPYYPNTIISAQYASNQLNIGDLIFGDMAGAVNYGLAGKVGINVRLPSVALEVSGTVSATRFVGDGSGLTGIGGSVNLSETIAINDLKDAASNLGSNTLFLGTSAGSNNTSGLYNTAAGVNAMWQNTSGSYNTAFGVSGLSSNVTGSYNTAVGFGVLAFSTSSYNTAVGHWAAKNTSTGAYNTALGALALYNNTTGTGNFAGGGFALQNGSPYNSVAVGYMSGGNVSGSTGNATLVGYYAGSSMTTGNNNTFLGAYSGRSVTAGGSNIAIGYNADAPTATTSSSLNIGNSIFGDMTNAAAGVGGASLIGINVVTPTASLEVSGTVSATALYVNGVAITGGGAANLSETIAINDLKDASASTAVNSMYLGSGAGVSSTASYNTGVGIQALSKSTNGGYNIATGYRALFNNTTGYQNVAYGYASLFSNVTNSQNVAYGSYALYNNTADQNTAVGDYALYTNTTGTFNSAIGANALFYNTTASYNMANGGNAMFYNSTGAYNAADGFGAMFYNTTGSYNTAVGFKSQYYNYTGDNNVSLGYSANFYGRSIGASVAIGANAGLGVSGSTTHLNSTFVGYASGQGITNGNGNTFLGAYSGATTTTGASNTLIGALAYAPTAGTSNWLNLANAISGSAASGGSMTFIGGIKANGIVTATYFEGDGSHLTGISGGTVNLSETIAINDLKDASSSVATASVFLGNGSGAVSTGYYNTGVGIGTLASNATGSNNVATGSQALYSNTTGSTNVAMGYQSLYAAVSATNNVAVGGQALRNNTDGGSNAATGAYALYANTNGSSNVATGSYALTTNTTGSQNVALGVNALYYPTPVVGTVAVGYNAGQGSGSTGYSYGTYVGTASGFAVTTGNNNTFFGAYSGGRVTTGSGNIALGYNVNLPTATSSYALNIGNSIFGDMTYAAPSVGGASLIGINMVTPSVALEVSGSVSVTSVAGTAVRGSSGSGTGVQGMSTATSGVTYGGYFSAASNQGSGVYAVATSATGTTYGVYGQSGSSNGYGVYGSGTTGVYGSGTNVGVSGYTGLVAGYAVYGNAPSDMSYGGYFTSAGNNGFGVSGMATNTGAGGTGVIGQSAANAGYGVRGVASAVSGTNYGVFGQAASPNGYAVYAYGNAYVRSSLTVSDTISTTALYVNGVAITGGGGGGSEITSGTTKVSTNSNGYISLTTGGVTTGYFDTVGRLVAPGIKASSVSTFQSSTMITGGYGMYNGTGLTLGGWGGSPNMASIGWGDGTGWKLNMGGYPSNVFTPKFTFVDTGKMGIGTQTPTVALEVNGTVSATQFVGDGSLLTGISGGGSEIASGTTKVSTNSNGYISLTTGGVTTGYFDTTGRLLLPNLTVTKDSLPVGLSVSGTLGVTNLAVAYNAGDWAEFSQPGDAILRSSVSGSLILAARTTNGSVIFGTGSSNTEKMRVSSAGLVGIGTSTPLGMMHISTTASVSAGLVIEASSATRSPRIALVDTISGSVSTQPAWEIDNIGDMFRIFRQPTLTTAGSVMVAITSTSQVGIGKQTPGYKLDVAGQVAGAGAYVNTSDARLKKDVTPIAYGLDTIMKLRPVGFNWIDQAEAWKKQHQLGLIAQEVEGVIPEVVSVANDTSRTRSLAYGELVPVLIKAVQDLKGENMQLQTENDQLKGDMKAMQDMLTKQNQRLDALEKRTIH